MPALDAQALEQLFVNGRSYNAFSGEIGDATLRRLYDLVRLGPTAVNGGPARFVFVRSRQAKDKLAPALSAGNLAKTLSAPVTVIVAHDENFHEKVPYLFSHHPGAKAYFEGPQESRALAALRNGSLQGAYLILAARALGLDTGPMSGFDNARVDEAFFKGTSIKSNFLVNLGRGDPASVFDRSPRLSFEEAARIE